MDITIRVAHKEDFPSVLALIKELAEFERSLDEVTNTVELMRKEQEHFRCFVAETGDKEIIGIALYFFAYYTWVGKSLYLEDIIVKKEFRGKKIGTALMEKIFEVARAEDCKRIRWQVLDWNSTAIGMYRKLGARVDNEWLNCTVDHDGIIMHTVQKS
ncbi:MAG: GNAT family N-acetyltransferase [Bacteroidales bacterium]|jgi:diamine N-acetyltransferase|nr:GNAT family N-acetyltransferase [Bacteroidales bacterium]